MATRLDITINEGSDVGLLFKIYDTTSSVIVPSSIDWWLYDSFNTAISSGTVSSLSSESLIVLSNSETMVNSSETRGTVKRQLHVKACYDDSELGNGVIEQEVFELTLCNNPFIGGS